jgi:signal transduction histidine kinase
MPPAGFVSAWSNIVPLVTHMWSDLKTKLERVFGRVQSAGPDVEAEDVTELREAIAHGASLGIVEQIVRNWEFERTRPRLERFAEQARSLAERLGKPDVAIELADNRVRLDGARFRSFWAAFSHVVRNAVDHGLESPSERAAAGKPEAGSMGLVTRRDDNAIVVELHDDGRGIDWDAVRTRARQANLPCASHDDLVAALFTDGITTRSEVTETSGRGVGLAALSEVCTSLGGTIDVHSERGCGARFVFRFELAAFARTTTKNATTEAPQPRSPSKGLSQPLAVLGPPPA